MTTSSEMQYLIGSVAQALQKGLSEVILKKPHDPIEYLATWLYAYQGTTRADREDALQAQKDVQTDKAKRIEEAEHEQLVAERENVAAEEAALNLSLQRAAEEAAPKAQNLREIMADLTSDADKQLYESAAEVEPETDREVEQPEQADAADLQDQTQLDEQQQELFQDGEQLQADEQPQETARTDQSDLAEAQALDDQLQLTARSDNAEDQPIQEDSARSQEAADAQDEQEAGAQDDQQADEPSEQADAPADTARSEADE